MIADVVTDSYELLYGEYPDEYNEVVLVLDKNNEVSATALYELGMLPSAEYKELMEKLSSGEEIKVDSQKWSYADFCEQTFYMIPACDIYQENADGLFESVADNDTEIEKLLKNAVELKISGVIRPKEDADYESVSEAFGYTKALTDYIIDHTNESTVVKAQEDNPDTNILSGVAFAPLDDNVKIEDAKLYIANLGVTE